MTDMIPPYVISFLSIAVALFVFVIGLVIFGALLVFILDVT